MRMGLGFGLAIVTTFAAGCTGTSSSPDAASQTFPLRVVVTDRSVQVYTDAADLGTCTCSALTFPAVGSCSGITDANPCDGNPYCNSCITDFGVEVDGQRLSPPVSGGTDPHAAYFDMLPAGQLSLVLAGCGHPSTRISLDGPAFLDASATADYVNGTAHVSWNTSGAPLGTLLEIDGGLGGDLCQVQDVSEYTFASWPRALGVQVWPLGSRADVDTAFGPATIWRAGNAWAQFPMSP